MRSSKPELKIIDAENSLERKSSFAPVASDILVTKLVPTFISGNILRRSRLLSKLSSNPEARLLLIWGTAGSGKSSLLYEYTKNQIAPVAWYTLQDSDRDIKVFLNYFLTSLGIYYRNIATKPLSKLNRMTNPDLQWEEVVISLINELHNYKKEMLIVLDDYHTIEEPSQSSIARIMDYILRNIPSNFKILIASRILPDLPLSYLSSKNALVMIRPEDLHLDSKEIRTLFHDLWEQRLSESALELIREKTEGWFAAVRLISQAISNRTEKEIEVYLKYLDFKENFIYDYLATEIYNRLPDDLRTFLKYTSILSSFNADIAASITELSGVERLFNMLEDMNLFVAHLDERDEWLRYHALFADFLRNVLHHEEEDLKIRDLHRKAGLWYEQKGNVAEAIEHFIEGMEWECVERLIIKNSQTLFQRGMINRLLKWISSLPGKNRDRSEDILLLEGELQDAIGNWESAIKCYEKAIELSRREKENKALTKILERLILCLIKYGEYSKLFRYCREALENCGENNMGLRSRIMSWLGSAHVICGDNEWENAYRMIKEAYLIAYKSREPEAIVAACISYGFTYHFPQGNFQSAEMVYNEGADLLRRADLPYLACHLLMNKAVVQIFGGNYEKARETINVTLKMAEEYELHFVKQALNLTLAMLHIEERNTKEAGKFLSIVTEREIPLQIKPWYYRTVALYHITKGNLGQADAAARDMLDHLNIVGRGLYAPECYITMGISCIKKNLHYKAKRWFEDALLTSLKGNMKLWIMKAHLCLAGLYALTSKDANSFRDHYRAALLLSGDYGYWHVWKTDIYNFTVPIVLFAYKYRIFPRETRKVIEVARSRLMDDLDNKLTRGRVEEKLLASRILGFMGDHDSKLLLKKASRDIHIKVRRKADELLQTSSSLAPPLSISTLGQFCVLRNDEPISEKEWGRKKAIKLFKYFLAHYPGEIITDQILETFWPELPVNKARHNLSVFLNYLRKALNPSGPRRDSTFLVCNEDLCMLQLRDNDYIDFIEFQHITSKGIDLLNAHKIEEAMELFRQALKIYRGDFLEGDIYEEWSYQKRKELLELYLILIESMASHYRKKGEIQEASVYYTLYLEKNPFHEKMMESVLECFAALGDRVTAKREYFRFRKLMKKRMGEFPSPSFDSMMKKVLHGH